MHCIQISELITFYRTHYLCEMAWHMKLSLPKFKVTQIGDTKTHRNVPRGRREAGSAVNLAPSPSDAAVDETDVPEHLEQSLSVEREAGPTVSLHAIKQKASAAAWDQVWATLQKAAIESSALPSDQGCILCADPATHRCTHCGAWAYYCRSCYNQAHSMTNFFHVGEVWEVCIF